MNVNRYSAEKLIKEDDGVIDRTGIEERGGSVQIITQNLEVINLVGKGYIKEKQLTPEQLGNYFVEIGKAQVSASRYEVSFAYHKQKKYWLIVAFPAPIEIQISMMINPESPRFVEEISSVVLFLVGYLIVTIVTIFMLSKKGASYFIMPLKELKNYTETLQLGDYSKRMSETLPGEFGQLQQKFYELAERLKQESEENRRITKEKDDMVLGISHDLKNPLTAISGYAEILADKKEIGEQKKKNYLNAILQNSQRANEILEKLFQFAQIESGGLNLSTTKIDFCEFIRLRIVETLDEMEIKGLEISYDIPEEEYWVMIDEIQMERVWQNLLGNAIKYNLPGGHVEIAVNCVQGKVILEIADDGIGMSKEEADKVFQPFIRNDKARNSQTGGSGLGLAVVKKIVEAHNGTISLETDREKGCHFKIGLFQVDKERY